MALMFTLFFNVWSLDCRDLAMALLCAEQLFTTSQLLSLSLEQGSSPTHAVQGVLAVPPNMGCSP